MLDFVVDNYLMIIIITMFLIFALIGYAVDSIKNKKNKEEELLTEVDDENLEKKEEILQNLKDEIENKEDSALNIPIIDDKSK